MTRRTTPGGIGAERVRRFDQITARRADADRHHQHDLEE